MKSTSVSRLLTLLEYWVNEIEKREWLVDPLDRVQRVDPTGTELG